MPVTFGYDVEEQVGFSTTQRQPANFINAQQGWPIGLVVAANQKVRHSGQGDLIENVI